MRRSLFIRSSSASGSRCIRLRPSPCCRAVISAWCSAPPIRWAAADSPCPTGGNPSRGVGIASRSRCLIWRLWLSDCARLELAFATRSSLEWEASRSSLRTRPATRSSCSSRRSATLVWRSGSECQARLRRRFDRSQRDPPAVTQVRVGARERQGLRLVRDVNDEEPVNVVTPYGPGLDLYPLWRVVQDVRGEGKRPPLYTHAARL